MSILNKFLGGGSQHLVGLDISSSAVKLLELSKRGAKFSVESYAVEALPPQAVVDKQIVEAEAVAEAISKAMSRAGSKVKNAAVAVSGAAVISKIITLSSELSDSEMEEQIKEQADQYIPYPVDEVNLDFEVLGPSEKQANSSDVLLAACRREQVDQRLEALSLAGLTGKVVDVESYALENACQFLTHQMPEGGKKKTVLIVDMGGSTTSVLVLHDLLTVYTRDQTFGGRQLTEEIMRHYGMSFEEAGKAKRAGSLPDDYQTEVLDRFIDDMAQQIDRSLQFFFSSSSIYTSIDQIILAGGCASIAGVDRAMSERLRIPTVIARPFAQMSVSSRAKPSVLARDEPSLLIACGLALRAFDDQP